MCYGDDARPPAPPIAGEVGEHGDLVLTSADGAQFSAYYAHPEQGGTATMVVLPDVRGLHHFYKELAQRFAQAGMHSIAIDYFGRTAGMGERGEDFPFREHVEKLTRPNVSDDIAAALSWMRSAVGDGAHPAFTTGFCMGGAYSWAQSAGDHGLKGCIGFYGVPSRVADLVPEMSTPLLLLAAGQDFTPVEEVEKFAGQVRAVGTEAELHVYPDAPHSFFDRTFGEHEAACTDSWRRILDFVGRHSS